MKSNILTPLEAVCELAELAELAALLLGAADDGAEDELDELDDGDGLDEELCELLAGEPGCDVCTGAGDVDAGGAGLLEVGAGATNVYCTLFETPNRE